MHELEYILKEKDETELECGSFCSESPWQLSLLLYEMLLHSAQKCKTTLHQFPKMVTIN